MYNKVTISGQVCTGKTTLFWNLSRKLLWPTFSVSLFFRDYAKLHHTSLQKAEEQTDAFTKEIDFGVKKLLQTRTEIIVEGWMAGLMAESIPNTLRILLTCDEKTQIKRYADREGISSEKAKKEIEERESNLFASLEKIHHRSDFLDTKKYDLVINTSIHSSEETLQEVLNVLQKPAGA